MIQSDVSAMWDSIRVSFLFSKIEQIRGQGRESAGVIQSDVSAMWDLIRVSFFFSIIEQSRGQGRESAGVM